MTTYVNWDIGGLVEIQEATDTRTNGPVLLITMSQSIDNNTRVQNISYPIEKLTEVEIALANAGFTAL